jgi:hypothetical protein
MIVRLGSTKGDEQQIKARRFVRESSNGIPGSRRPRGEDLEHSGDEHRRLRVAKSRVGRVLVIAYTIRSRNNEEIIRIISARQASRKERQFYETEED